MRVSSIVSTRVYVLTLEKFLNMKPKETELVFYARL
jgi:hypothetical protein